LILTSKFQGTAGRVTVWTISLLLTLGIGLSRVYLGVHYPSDVLAGWLTGAMWVTFLHIVFRTEKG
jgi:undecaprenyl-diphosphatase